jgi:nicotinamide-nucleotide adenylyltransferase
VSAAGGPPKYETGVIHGRFQVLHRDHLRYLLAGHALCHHLVVGITNPDPTLTREDRADPHRSRAEANPLTYYERYQLVRAALSEAGVTPDAFSIVPLPINLPELYRYYVPLDAVFLVSVTDEWGRQKVATFRSLGLRTRVLWDVPAEEKGLSSTAIRALMLRDEPWEHLVPSRVAALLRRWNVPARIAEMAAHRPPGA